MSDALLTCDSTYEQDVWQGRIYTVFGQRCGIRCLLIFIEIYAVIDDMHSFGTDVGVCAQNVFFRSLGNGDYGVCIKNRGSLHPGTHRITTAELLGLPAAQRFEAMGCEYERNVE